MAANVIPKLVSGCRNGNRYNFLPVVLLTGCCLFVISGCVEDLMIRDRNATMVTARIKHDLDSINRVQLDAMTTSTDSQQTLSSANSVGVGSRTFSGPGTFDIDADILRINASYNPLVSSYSMGASAMRAGIGLNIMKAEYKLSPRNAISSASDSFSDFSLFSGIELEAQFGKNIGFQANATALINDGNTGGYEIDGWLFYDFAEVVRVFVGAKQLRYYHNRDNALASGLDIDITGLNAGLEFSL